MKQIESISSAEVLEATEISKEKVEVTSLEEGVRYEGSEAGEYWALLLELRDCGCMTDHFKKEVEKEIKSQMECLSKCHVEKVKYRKVIEHVVTEIDWEY